ncbi:MAG: hypothetical protein NXI04_12855 [Planctomycetaceae bacterium]|nr:hypothetical protein [Planctomycetaceae bacterium]
MLVALFLTPLLLAFLFVATIPFSCWEMMQQNSYRLDGSFSQRRSNREYRSLAAHAGNLLTPALLIGLIAFVSTTYFFERVMPFPVFLESLTVWDSDPETQDRNLEQLGRSHSEAMTERGISAENIRIIQQSLWRDWPNVLLAIVVFFVVAFVVFVGMASRSAAELVAGIRHRRRVYARADVCAMQDAADEIQLQQMCESA